ncbi:MAG: ATP-dependent helicase [Chlorobium sp.]|nr:ATP-dependent helicase [Chlorobium sp.]
MIKRFVQQQVFDPAKAYSDCNKAQKQAIDQTEGAVMVVAGPGTGKTQIIAARIANILQQDIAPENILCLTYTDAGTIAMRERLLSFIGTDAYRVNIFTFHAFCNNVIQENSSYFGFSDLKPVSDLEKAEIVQKLLDSLPHDNPLAKITGDLHSDTKALIDLYATMKRESWDVDADSKAIDDYIASLPSLPEMKYTRKYKEFKVGDLKTHEIDKETKKYERSKAAIRSFSGFQELMREHKRYDFEDMIVWVIAAFRSYPELLIEYQERYQYTLVDEYQDTSSSQNEVVDLLMQYWDDPNLFVVGDDDQSIYRFQGANIENILSFNDKYTPTTVVLTDNYRSTQQILDASMALIDANNERITKSATSQAMNITKNLTAARQPAGDMPNVISYPSTMQESLGVALEIESRHDRGEDLSKIAVLYRGHKQAETIIQYLRAKGVPYSTKRREDILANPNVKQLLNILTYLNGEIHSPHSQERTLFVALQHPSLGFSPIDIARLYIDDNKDHKRIPIRERLVGSKVASVYELIETSISEYGAYSLQEYIHRLLSRFGILAHISESDDVVWQMTALNTFFGFIREECSKSPRITLEDLLRLVGTMQSRNLMLQADRVVFDKRGVNLITNHSSKGLEFETVFLIGCNQNEWEGKRSQSGFATPPNRQANKSVGESAKLEELRRLFYVAMTRAEKELFISYATRSDSDKDLARSQFVAELEKSGTVLSMEYELEAAELEAATQYILKPQPEENDDLFTSDLIGERLKQFRLSVSSLNTYLKCPRTFFFESLVRVPQINNGSMAFGTSVHKALEFVFKAMKESPEQLFPPVEDFIARFEKDMYRNQDAFDETTFKRRLASGRDTLTRYYEFNSPSWYKKVLLEEHFETIMDGIPIHGLVDKLEIIGHKANVVDYKTGKYDEKKLQPPNPAKVQKAEDANKEPKHEDLLGSDYWRQAVFYKLMVEHNQKHSYQVDTSEFSFVEPDEKSGEFINHSVEISAEDEETVRQQIIDAYGKIMRREFGGKCKSSYCAWCK